MTRVAKQSGGQAGLFQYSAASCEEGGWVGYLAKPAGQILLHGRSQTGPASLCALCPAIQAIPASVRQQRCLNVVGIEAGFGSIPLHIGESLN